MDIIGKISKIKDGFVKKFYTQKRKENYIRGFLLDAKKKKTRRLLLTLNWALSQQSIYCLGSGFQLCRTRMSVLYMHLEDDQAIDCRQCIGLIDIKQIHRRGGVGLLLLIVVREGFFKKEMTLN